MVSGLEHPSDPAHPANNLAHPANWMVPTSHPFHPSHPIGQLLHGRRLLARQVKADDSEQVSQMKADSEVEPDATQLEPEPTRGLLLYKGWKHPNDRGTYHSLYKGWKPPNDRGIRYLWGR